MNNKNCYYVYLHRRSTDNKVFYVGKGKGYRCKSKYGRNDRWTKTYRKHGLIVEIVYDNLSEEEAFALEIETITEMRYHFEGTICNLTNGGEGASGYKASDYTKNLIGIHSRARSHILSERNKDKKIYRFLKADSSVVFTGTRHDLSSTFGLNHASLRNMFISENANMASQGFILMLEDETIQECFDRYNKSREGRTQGILDNRVYSFYNIFTKDLYTGTKKEFSKYSGISQKAVSNITMTRPVSLKYGIVLLEYGKTFEDFKSTASNITLKRIQGKIEREMNGRRN